LIITIKFESGRHCLPAVVGSLLKQSLQGGWLAMRFVNCTPHAINILREDGSIMTVESSGVVVRVETTQEIVGNIDGVPVVRTVFNNVTLPEPQDGVVYIVSTVVLQALQQMGICRDDLVAPDTGPQSAVRDGTGQIVAIRRFQVL